MIVYKHGIRTTEFFQDHDKLRSGLVTENQFACGLSLCFRGKTSTLSRDRVQTLVDAYGTGDGRVRYRDFCHVMENAFNEADLEKRPTQVVVRPLKGTLAWVRLCLIYLFVFIYVLLFFSYRVLIGLVRSKRRVSMTFWPTLGIR